MIENVKPSVLRKYIYEYSLIGLCGCVIFLFFQFNELNKYIRNDLTAQKAELIRTINENTNALKQVTK